MRIAFVSANREQLPDPVIPIGVLYVMAAVAREHDVELWDLCFEDDPIDAIRSRIDAFDPELVAIGLRNVQAGDYGGTVANVEYFRDLVAAARERTRAPVVLGGGGFSVIPRQLMEHLRPDFGIAGEGESAFVELVRRLEKGAGTLDDVGSLHHFRDGALVSNPPAAGFQDLDGLRPPLREICDPRYLDHGGISSVQTKRGCPLRCDYCTYPLIEGRSIRQRRPEAVVDELLAAREADPRIRHFFIVDAVFNLPPSHAKAICREMIARGFDTPWTCYANPIGFDRELADLMAAAGCAGVEVGSDSGVDAVLDRLRKGFRTDRIRALHEHCLAAGVPDCHTFILGTTGETFADVERTLDFCTDLDPTAAMFMIWTDDAESLDPELAESRRRFREEIGERMAAKAHEFPRWIIPSLGVNYDPRLFAALRRKGLDGPLWQHLPSFRPSRGAPDRPASTTTAG